MRFLLPSMLVSSLLLFAACSMPTNSNLSNTGSNIPDANSRSLDQSVMHLPFNSVLKSYPAQIGVDWGYGVLGDDVNYGESGVLATSFGFNGSAASVVTIPTDDKINFGTGDFSFACWFKTSKTNTFNTILDKRTAGGNGYHVILYDGKILLQMLSGGKSLNYWGSNSAPSFNDGKWHSLVITVDRDNTNGLRMIVDGLLVHTLNPTAISGSLSNSTNLLIGKHMDISDGNFVGNLDDIWMFKSVINTQDIATLTGMSSIAIGGSVSSNITNGFKSTHHGGSYARYYTVRVDNSSSLKINMASATDTYLVLLKGSGINGTVIAENDDRPGTTNSEISAFLTPGIYTIEATTYNTSIECPFTLSVNTIDISTRLGEEIEAKWDIDEATYNTLVNAFPNGLNKYGYTMNVRWDGIPRKFVDFYHDQSPSRPLQAANHSFRYRMRYENTSGLGVNPTLASLEAASWGKLEWRKIQYKSTPMVISPVWFRSETSIDIGSEAAAQNVLKGIDKTNAVNTKLLIDHPTFNFANILKFTTVTDYRYRIELQKAGVPVLEISLDRIKVLDQTYWQGECELIKETRTMADIIDLQTVAAQMQAEFNLKPANSAKSEY